ncbi:MAG: serine hydrolase domain-containing protein [Thermomicrobiales bacterium]
MTSPAWAAEVQAFTRGMMGAHDVPGLAVAVARHGAEVYAEGFGTREVGTDAPVTPDTVFGVASVTKSFTALAIMQLHEAGTLSVDDPVTRYLPEFRTPDPAATRAITLHHFLTHTSGLPPLPSRFFAFARSMEGDPAAGSKPTWSADHAPIDTYEDLMDYLAEGGYALLGPPGAQFSYCNEGFALLGAIIERVSGEGYEPYVQRHILDSAGMTRSTYDVEMLRTFGTFGNVVTFHATRQTDGKREIYAAPNWLYSSVWSPAGGLNSTVRDLLRYLEIYRTGGMTSDARLLSAAGIARMTTPFAPRSSPGSSYGYGLGVIPDYHGLKLIKHGGGRKGISAEVIAVPATGFTGAAIANLAGVPVATVTLAALNRTRDLPVDATIEEYEDVPCPVDLLPHYTGTYRGGEGQQITVSAEDGALVYAFEGQRIAVRPVGEHAFVLATETGEVYTRFLIADGAPATAVTMGSRIVPRTED